MMFIRKYLILLCAGLSFAALSPSPLLAETSPTIRAELKQQLRDIGVSKPFLNFIAKEAEEAGVKAFRPLPLKRLMNSGLFKPGYRLYGHTRPNGTIYLDTGSALGRHPFIVLHEIAHVPTYGGACGGHHRAWAEEFVAISKRFHDKFPKQRWYGLPPHEMARALGQQYGALEACK